MTLSMPFKSKLGPHRYRDGKGLECACPLTLRMEICQSIRHQDDFFFCNLVTSKVELIEKVIPTLSNDLGETWKGATCKNKRRPTLVSNQDFFNFGLCDMNSNTHKGRAT